MCEVKSSLGSARLSTCDTDMIIVSQKLKMFLYNRAVFMKIFKFQSFESHFSKQHEEAKAPPTINIKTWTFKIVLSLVLVEEYWSIHVVHGLSELAINQLLKFS